MTKLSGPDRKRLDREIIQLAVPALGALIAQPVVLATDSAMVGHLGSAALGGLAVASSLLQTIVGLTIFLAFATTPAVARRVGAGDYTGAYASGFSSALIAAGLGILLVLLGIIFGPTWISWYNPEPEVLENASSYFQISIWGLPAILLGFAAVGFLRGLQDTKTALFVSSIGAFSNVILNFVLIYGLNLGVAGSAYGTVLVQWLMFLGYAAVIGNRFAKSRLKFSFEVSEFLSNLKTGFWLFVRTISLRISILSTIVVATRMGTEELAAYYLVTTVLNFVSFALESIEISAQTLVAKELGAKDFTKVRQVVSRSQFWAFWFSLSMAIIVIALSGILGNLFSSDPKVLELVPIPLVVMAISIPLAGYVFVLDGVLVGAKDVKYLAFTGIINMICFLPLLVLIMSLNISGIVGAVALILSYCFGYMAARAATLTYRITGTKWLEFNH